MQRLLLLLLLACLRDGILFHLFVVIDSAATSAGTSATGRWER